MTYLFLCGGSYVFGQEIIELNIMRELASRGERVHCLANGWNDGQFVRRLDEAGIPYTIAFTGKLTMRIRRLGWTLDALRHLTGARRTVRKLLLELRPDVIVACNRDTVVLLKRLLATQCVAYHVQEVPEPSTRARVWTFVLARSVSGFIATSEFVKFRLLELGVGEQLLCVAQAGIDLPRHERGDWWEAPLKAHREPPVVGICGQIAPWKGHEDLIDALAILFNRQCDFRVVIYGDGDAGFVSHLRHKIEACGFADRVCWPGYQTDRDHMYASCDIIVVPSRFDDPFPTTVLEAGAYGLPVVATTRGGIPEQVEDGVTGLLVPDRHPELLAEKIGMLLESNELREHLGHNARSRVTEAFQSRHMADRFTLAVQGILAAHALRRKS